MAITVEKNYTRCQVSLQSGLDGEGKPVLKSVIFGRIHPDAANQDIYDVVQSILSLQELPVLNIRRLDDGELVNG